MIREILHIDLLMCMQKPDLACGSRIHVSCMTVPSLLNVVHCISHLAVAYRCGPAILASLSPFIAVEALTTITNAEAVATTSAVLKTCNF